MVYRTRVSDGLQACPCACFLVIFLLWREREHLSRPYGSTWIVLHMEPIEMKVFKFSANAANVPWPFFVDSGCSGQGAVLRSLWLRAAVGFDELVVILLDRLLGSLRTR